MAVLFLLRISLPPDNAAMGDKSPNLVPRKRKRRWHQFSLRTLLIGVTIFCIAAGWFLSQAATVWTRKAMLKDAPLSWVDDDESAGIPWLRHAMGDRGMGMIVLDKSFTDEQLDHYRSVFPEAFIYRTDIAKAQSLSAAPQRRSFYSPRRH
ncbi:MAG TPA: hypothetical protein VKB78_05880 [Pirellulales bacterium]|nr:hypothetical protein [Pirellulales bacterium]